MGSRLHVGDAVSYGWKGFTKNVGQLIVIALVLMLLNFVGALLCGIGMLVTLPVTAIALAFAWRTVTGGTRGRTGVATDARCRQGVR